VDVLRHDNISDDDELEAAPDFFEDAKEGGATAGRPEQRPAAVTTEGQEVEVAVAVIALQAFRHGREFQSHLEGTEVEQ
jgi:hypothetical protein